MAAPFAMSNSGSLVPRRRIAGAVIALAIIVGALLALRLLVENDSAGPEDGVTLNALVANEERFVGEVVTVSGAVDADLLPEAASGFSFLIGAEAEGNVLVIPARSDLVPRALGEGDVVRVTGEVFRVAPDEDRGTNVLPEGGILERFEDSPSIQATDIEVIS